LDEKEKMHMPEGEPSETELDTEQEDTKAPSQEELAAREKMENIFRCVSKNQPEQGAETPKEEPVATDGAQTEDAQNEAHHTEIELMTVTKPTTEQQEALDRRKQEEKKRKNQTFARKLFFAAVVVLAVIAGGFCYTDYMPTKERGKEVVVTVPAGAGTEKIAALLEKDGLIHSKFFYRAMSKLRGVDGRYNFGKFKLNRGAGYEEIFDVLTQSGENVNVVKVTIPEGYEIYKIADLLEAKGLIDKDKFYYLVDYGEFDYEFVKEIPERDNRLEGYLFPSTYEFAANDEYGIINEMLMQFDKLYKKYKERAKEMNMTMDEAVTLASIVEREAMGAEDRKLVSSVFHNRLESSSYPYLQSCATVQYVLRERKPVLSVEDTKIDSPYNTYINKGLPIGPIASPGEAALEAALNPAQSEYLFFVLGSDGKHHFSKTFGEHIQNKQ